MSSVDISKYKDQEVAALISTIRDDRSICNLLKPQGIDLNAEIPARYKLQKIVYLIMEKSARYVFTADPRKRLSVEGNQLKLKNVPDVDDALQICRSPEQLLKFLSFVRRCDDWSEGEVISRNYRPLTSKQQISPWTD